MATVGGGILAMGAALARLAAHEARLNKLERGAEDQGRRLGEVAGQLEAAKAAAQVEREYTRRLTAPPLPPER
jgi:hypothetical protein